MPGGFQLVPHLFLTKFLQAEYENLPVIAEDTETREGDTLGHCHTADGKAGIGVLVTH